MKIVKLDELVNTNEQHVTVKMDGILYAVINEEA